MIYTVCIVGSVAQAKAQEGVKISGLITTDFFSSKQELIRSEERSFSISVKGCEWLAMSKLKTNIITNERIANLARKANIESRERLGFTGQDMWYEIGGDGLAIYSIFFLGDYKAAGEGFVLPGAVPPDDGKSAIAPLWLAYASACYFETNTEKTMRAIWPLRGSETFWITNKPYAADWRKSETFPTFLSWLNVYHPGVSFSFKSNGVQTVSLEPPYHTGYRSLNFGW